MSGIPKTAERVPLDAIQNAIPGLRWTPFWNRYIGAPDGDTIHDDSKVYLSVRRDLRVARVGGHLCTDIDEPIEWTEGASDAVKVQSLMEFIELQAVHADAEAEAWAEQAKTLRAMTRGE